MNRFDFVFFFDVTDGNPNGDPDAGNLPRVDPETGQGLVTDVCLKRKVRDYVDLLNEQGATPDNGLGYQIFVRSGTALNAAIAEAHEATGGMPPSKSGKWITNKAKAGDAASWLCQNYFDIRSFGAVLSTGPNAGQIRGPIQFGFARSIDQIRHQEFAITRCATTDDKLSAKVGVTSQTYRDWEANQPEDKLRTIGRKYTVPYALYCAHGFINPHLAHQTGFNEADLDLFKTAMGNMFEFDRSAARGVMTARACIAFKHESPLGNAPAHKLLSLVQAKRANGNNHPARKFEDYEITRLDEIHLPEGVQGITPERWF